VQEFPTALPPTLAQQLAGHRDGLSVKVCAQEETRLGLQPISRRRMTACGGQPGATGWPRLDNVYLCGAVEPTTGERLLLELPRLNSAMLQLGLDDCARTCAAAFNILGLDKGALHTAQILRWPSNVTAVPLPPDSPARNPIERLWRERKEQVAATVVKTLDALSDPVCRLIQSDSQAALKSLPGCAYFVQAVQTTLRATNG
jgi:hypothetical protein